LAKLVHIDGLKRCFFFLSSPVKVKFMLSPIRHEQNLRTGIFYINDRCERKAFIAYFENPENVLQLTHTFVSDDLRGQGIAGRLAKHALEYALANNLKVIAVCSYIKKWLLNKVEYKGVVLNP
jgi:uncharacterized protein